MFVSHIAELSDAHLYFTKFRKCLGALPPPPGKKSSYATVTPTPAELHPAISFTPGFRGSGLQGDVHACTPSSIWSGPKDVSLVTAMCDRDYIAGEAQMHRKLRCDTG